MITAADAGSVNDSLTFLSEQTWWQRFREGRDHVPLIDDVISVGHFYRWLDGQRIPITEITSAHLDAYVNSLASMRPGPRGVYERAASALLSFFGAPSSLS